MHKAFMSLPRLVQILLLLIPGVNLITEIVVRVSAFIAKPTLMHLLVVILAIITLGIIGWIDLVWCLLFKKLILM